MNIFVFSPSPWKSALWLDDVRKNKMILESAQMLSTAIRCNTPETRMPIYQSTHLNHPCNVWVRESRANFKWLLCYMEALHIQRNRPHKSARLLHWFGKYLSDGYFPTDQLTRFTNCARRADMGIDYTYVTNVHKAYRLYIVERWKDDNINLSWEYGKEPKWRK